MKHNFVILSGISLALLMGASVAQSADVCQDLFASGEVFDASQYIVTQQMPKLSFNQSLANLLNEMATGNKWGLGALIIERDVTGAFVAVHPSRGTTAVRWLAPKEYADSKIFAKALALNALMNKYEFNFDGRRPVVIESFLTLQNTLAAQFSVATALEDLVKTAQEQSLPADDEILAGLQHLYSVLQNSVNATNKLVSGTYARSSMPFLLKSPKEILVGVPKTAIDRLKYHYDRQVTGLNELMLDLQARLEI